MKKCDGGSLVSNSSKGEQLQDSKNLAFFGEYICTGVRYSHTSQGGRKAVVIYSLENIFAVEGGRQKL